MIVLLCAAVFPPFRAPDEVTRNGRTNRILSCSYILDAYCTLQSMKRSRQFRGIYIDSRIGNLVTPDRKSVKVTDVIDSIEWHWSYRNDRRIHLRRLIEKSKTTEELKKYVVDEFTEISGELATHGDNERVNATISSGQKYPAASLNRVDSLEKFLSASSSRRRVFYGS